GSLGNSGTVAFMFSHKCYFHIAPKDGITLDDLELELIDYGAEEFDQDEEEIIISGAFESNGDIQKYLEDNGFEIKSSEFVYEPADYKELNAEQQAEVEALIEVLEEDEDVQNVFTNMKEADVEE
ncbi:MAG: YebC/PmpR family DNA-binding transcriptional regulator, partial [Muribaculaceae bacterium]|nr:YebC/PmpR family DNA-binding transcriptional regulator [Muribaculaceae bacterium]